MKLGKLFVLALALCLLGTCLLACGDESETTTGGTMFPVIPLPLGTSEPETAELTCEHPNMTETVVLEATCTETGKILRKCKDCNFVEEIVTDFAHDDIRAYSEALGVNESTCALCGDSAVVVDAGKRVKLSAYCEGALGFTLTAASADETLEILLDGKSLGNASFDDEGKAAFKAEELEKGAHSVVFVNKGENAVRIKSDKIEGHFNKPGAVYVEVLGKGSRAYSDFNVYLQTSDPSEQYYVCYRFTYNYNEDVNNFNGNSLTNTEFYRVNGATLYRIIDADDTLVKVQNVDGIGTVLGGGEISFAVMQQYPYLSELAADAKTLMGTETRAMDYIGGFHGDEWMSHVLLMADGEAVDLQSAEKTVIPCSAVTFDLTGTMYAWGTSREGSRGVPVAEHIQNFVMDSTGVVDVQTIEWLRDDFVIHAAYLPMFTMMRGKDGNRFIETVRAYDADGNLKEEYVMAPEYVVTKQTNVLFRTDCSMYEYTGDKGVNAKVSFKSLNGGNKFTSSYVALRVGVDNKLYVGVNSAKGGSNIPKGDVWQVELGFKIDYVKPTE